MRDLADSAKIASKQTVEIMNLACNMHLKQNERGVPVRPLMNEA